jgi:[protein-PII] uridylyltransferase
MVFVVLSRYANNRLTLSSKEMAKRMKDQILNPQPGKDPKQARLPRTLRHFQIDTIVRFSDRPDSDNTVLEVIAQDRPGLLHHVAKAFLRCKIHLVSAKVSTFGERAEDIFYITDRDGHCVDRPASRERISRQIRSALPS